MKEANQEPKRMTMDQVVAEINRALGNDNVSRLLEMLQDPLLGLDILTFAATLYFSELNYIRQTSGTKNVKHDYLC